MVEVKVGDKLVKRSGWGNDPRVIGEVERITPSGQIVCGGSKFKERFGVLREVGSTSWRSSVEVLTPEIQTEINNNNRRNRCLSILYEWKYQQESTEILEAVCEIIAKSKKESDR